MNTLLEDRCAGVLLHPSSLPGDSYCGTFGVDARRFVDLLVAAGIRIWQLLPLGPTHTDLCPYQSLSVHAGNPDLLDLHWLVVQNLLSDGQAQAGAATPAARHLALGQACDVFLQRIQNNGDDPMAVAYRQFLHDTAYWLEDYSRYQAFRDSLGGLPWTDWPAPLRNRDPAACASRARELGGKMNELRFIQFIFHSQWHELRRYANERGVLLFGDMPIYVHLDSADVWAHQSLFDLDDNGQPVTITGVPPDYFCTEGQLWGNPQYNWARMEETGFEWWLQRFGSATQRFDIARIDHFRALQAYWEIAAEATSARQGRWVAAPGRALLEAVRRRYPELRLVAENLGIISPEVEALRREFSLPGMVILQFAFDGNPDNPYLTHLHATEDIVYTGTHDNDTTLGWFESLDTDTRAKVYRYFDNPTEAMPWMLIRQAMASPANTAIIPWQDFLGLDGSHRMNTPGTREGNWRWRFSWAQVPGAIEERIRKLLAEYDRLAAAGQASSRVAGG